MPKIPTHIADILPPADVGKVKPPAGLYGAKGAIVSQAAEQIGQAAIVFQEARRAKRQTTLTARMYEQLGRLKRESWQDTDYDTMAERYETKFQDTREELLGQLRDEGADRELEGWFSTAFDRVAETYRMDIQHRAWTGQVDAGRAATAETVDALKGEYRVAETDVQRREILLQVGDIVNRMTERGFFSAQERGAYLKDTVAEFAEEEFWGDLDIDPDTALQKLEEGKYEQIPEERARQLKTQARVLVERKQREAEAVAKEQEAEQREAAYNHFVGKFATGQPVSVAEIMSSALAPREKEHFVAVLDRRNDEVAKGNADPFKESDPAIRADVLRRVHTDPSLYKDDIITLMGNGLSVSDTEHFMKELERVRGKEDVTKTSHMKRSLQVFDRALSAGIYGDKDDKETLKKHSDDVNEFERRVAETGAEGEEITAIAMEILERQEDGLWRTLWRRFMGVVFGESDELSPEGTAVTMSPEDAELRTEAIRLLRESNKTLDEESIKIVMDYLREQGRKGE